MRRASPAVLAVVTLAACTPEIGTGVYFCGPERSCPPELACDEPTYTCVTPVSATPFACPDGSEDAEPDDDLAGARALGTIACGQPLFGGDGQGCLAAGGPIDLFGFRGNACEGNALARVAITLRFPIAFAPLQLELLDGDGAVVATSTACEVGQAFGGLDAVCLASPVDDADYYVRVSVDPDGPDCDGGCAQAPYLLEIASLLT